MFWLTARWFALRVDILAILCQLCILSLGVVSASQAQNPAVIGLAVTYSLLLTTTVQVGVFLPVFHWHFFELWDSLFLPNSVLSKKRSKAEKIRFCAMIAYSRYFLWVMCRLY
jgi:hypothetical protein